jgi:acyl-[acyl-carrier-protein]-phospholipid O-acyltransferase/long-chain-fatty-acid--[acyl-carrier-protein] ligase
VLKSMIRALLRLLFRVRVEGDAGHLSEPRLLIIANHQSFLDGLILGAFLPVDPVFVVHTEVTRNFFFRLLLSLSEYLAVDPTNPMGMKRVVRLIESGRPVVIFPEGRITLTGSLMKVYDGPAFVAARTGAVIAPVRLDGATRTYFSRLSGSNPRALFPRITVSLQPPASIAMPLAATGRLRRRKAGEGMRKIMQEMIFRSHPIQTLYDALVDAMRVYGRSRRLVEDMKQTEYSYNALLKMTLVLGLLVRRQSARGETVGILLPNLAATLCMVIGMTAFRRIPAMLNYTAGTDGMQSACIAARIATIVTSRKFLDTAKLQGQVNALQGVKVIYLEDLQPQVTLGVKLWALLHLFFPRLLGRGVSEDSVAVVLFTSGSEGLPKGVVLTHANILSNCAQLAARIDFGPGDTLFNVLPVFHSFGFTGGMVLPLVSGVKLYLDPSPLHYRIIPELVYGSNATVIFGTDTFLAGYAKTANPYDFRSLRYVLSGAEAVKAETRRIYNEKFGLRILEGYGVTETSPVLAVNTPMFNRNGTVGRILPGMEARLDAVDGILEGGRLFVRGPNIMAGYLRAEAPGVLEPPADGWHDTGDIVVIDPEGFVAIRGRAKRFAKIAGEMVSLAAVEQMVAELWPEAMTAVVAAPDAKKGERLVLVTTQPKAERSAVSAHMKAKRATELMVPAEVLVVDRMPVLGSGKTDYVALNALVRERAAAKADAKAAEVKAAESHA